MDEGMQRLLLHRLLNLCLRRFSRFEITNRIGHGRPISQGKHSGLYSEVTRLSFVVASD